MFQHILVPLDGSERAERAIPVAARLARGTGGSITLLRIVTSPFESGWQGMDSPVSMQESLDLDQVDATEYLTRISTDAMLAGIATSTSVYKGAPGTGILTVARSQKADIIIMCSHGYTAMTRWALGSVAEKVAFHASTPVLVLREGGHVLDDLSPDPQARQLRALVALDGSTRAEMGIEYAARLIVALAEPAQGALHLAQVVKPVPEGSKKGGIGGGESEAIAYKAEGYLDSTAKRLREGQIAPAMEDLPLSVTCSVAVDADVASALISMAESPVDAVGDALPGGCDIMVMTTHGSSGIASWALGSITERVLKASKLPLLIIRPLDILEKSNFVWGDTTLTPM